MGRPRKFPEGATASTRMSASNKALQDAGGMRKTVRLSKGSVDAITALKERWNVKTDLEVIERALMESAQS